MTDTSNLRVLAIAAHPDDADLSSGGTITKWAAAGHEIRYVVCTNGDKGTHDRAFSPHRLAEAREEEQQHAARMLGVREVIFLRYRDGELEAARELRTELAILIRHFRPHIIFTHDPWRPYQIHPDHRAAGLGTTDAIVAARDHLFLPALGVIGLEPFAPQQLLLWGSEASDYFEDISDTIEQKLAAVAEHRSQIPQMPEWEPRVRQWAAEVGAKAGMSYAEGFKRIEFRPAGHVIPTPEAEKAEQR